VLLYGSERWSLTRRQEQRIITFYSTCLLTSIGLNLGDRLANEKLLDITGQPSVINSIRRNRLRWFGHVNRAVNHDGWPSLIKKAMLAYFYGKKRPSNMRINKRWENKVLKNIEELYIGNCRRMTPGRSRWCETMNKDVHLKPEY